MTMLTSDHIHINQSWLLHVRCVDVSEISRDKWCFFTFIHSSIAKNIFCLKVFSHHEIKRIRSFEKKLTFSSLSLFLMYRSLVTVRQNKHIAAVHSCVNHFNRYPTAHHNSSLSLALLANELTFSKEEIRRHVNQYFQIEQINNRCIHIYIWSFRIE